MCTHTHADRAYLSLAVQAVHWKEQLGIIWFTEGEEVQCSCESCVSCYIGLYVCKLMADGGRLTSTKCPRPSANDLVPVSKVRVTKAESGLILVKVSTSRRVSSAYLFKKVWFSKGRPQWLLACELGFSFSKGYVSGNCVCRTLSNYAMVL